LRQAIADHYRRHFGEQLDPDHICVTSGATEALGAMILSTVEPDDEVIIFTPPTTVMPLWCGGRARRPREVALQPPYWTDRRETRSNPL
jgi:aspartate/methionine/tyrosine aminotransferase